MSDAFLRTVSSVYSFGRTLGTPDEQADRATVAYRQASYQLRWGYYDGTAYSDLEAWARYKDDHRLPWSIRTLRNTIKKLVDFYALHIYSGTLADDGRTLPRGERNAIPIDYGDNELPPRRRQRRAADGSIVARTGSELTGLPDAIGQLWQWWGWVEQMRLFALYPAAVGDSMVELIDDIPRRKIMTEMIWPGYIRDLILDPAGNIKEYTKEFTAIDKREDGSPEEFVYRRTMTTRKIQTYRNGNPWDYETGQEGGPGADIVNPYGFVPARWVRFWSMGGVYGEPAMFGNQSVYDELQSLWSRANDNLSIALDAPILVAGEIAPGSISTAMEGFYEYEQQRPASAMPSPLIRKRLVEVEADVSFKRLEIDVSQVVKSVDMLNEAINDAFPEVRFSQYLREMTALSSAPAMDRALIDISARYSTIGATMDRHMKAIQQMGVAMGGLRRNDGSWEKAATAAGEPLTAQHDKFKDYGLSSFGEGRLDHNILSRDLVPDTPEERAALGIQKDSLDVPRPIIVGEAFGYDQDDFEDWEGRGLSPVGFWTGGDNVNANDTAQSTGETAAVPAPGDRLDQLLGNDQNGNPTTTGGAGAGAGGTGTGA